MSFFKQPELNILNSYPINQTINVSDYLCDFVLQNPLNYPYSSYIMKNTGARKSLEPLKDQYSRDSVLENISKSRGRDDICEVYYNMLHLKNPSFTTLAMCLHFNYGKAKITIHQKEPVIIMSINDGTHKHTAMIDSSGSTILCYHSSDVSDIYPMFGRTWNSVAEVSSNCEAAKHYYFEYTDTDEVLNILDTIHAITCHKPPSWYMSDFDESLRYKYKDSIMGGYNILRLCDSSFECVDDALVTNTIKEKSVSHQESVILPANDLFNKTIVD